MTLSEELRSGLSDRGACVVGYADLSGVPEESRWGYGYGIIIAVELTPCIISGIENGPTPEYYDEYLRVNTLLNSLGEYAEGLLKNKGFEALALTQKVVEIHPETKSTRLPHKTVATRAGIGWIGKNAMLITRERGSAIRLTSVLTNCPLEAGIPINGSRCGSCTVCRDSCPGGAITGREWNVEMERAELYDAFKCRKTARERSRRIGVDESLCGLCILKCPWTQRHLEKLQHKT
ncbi:epoxyqueuosine reductase [Ruminiclostridium hungatei]|uniref:Epoxyqueuosine reductase n=1 Tax=Ruminiclostridium hungatei TaxID=48256 RepID=A0A1V4SN53_RUMHU|nr:4Fe-4S double cluster binding domain-containing protein [Ruminiclostridium hungatei]OPX45233.1 epoxyqueuosine reductase [Ruminiclostridium hungatei]